MTSDPSMHSPDAPPPLWAHNARRTDPQTSHEAADKSAKASAHSIHIVRTILADGVARTDEEIHAMALRLLESAAIDGWTADVSRHGRKHLCNSGEVVDSGLRGKTRTNSTAIRWRKIP